MNTEAGIGDAPQNQSPLLVQLLRTNSANVTADVASYNSSSTQFVKLMQLDRQKSQ